MSAGQPDGVLLRTTSSMAGFVTDMVVTAGGA
jgi:hypothetical protein